MIVDVFADGPPPLLLLPTAAPLTDAERSERALARLVQRLRLRLTVARGSVPLDRAFGLDPDLIDAPVSTALPRLRVAVTQALRPEPQCRLLSVDAAPSSSRPGLIALRVRVAVDPATLSG